jgi:nucleoside-diphosphate-sugar epimerase
VDDRASLDAAVEGVDAVIHSAGLVKAREPAEFAAVNVEGTRNLLEALVATGSTMRRFVLVSSLTAAGPSFDGKPDSPDACRPVTHYGRSKARAEEVARSYADRASVVVVRPPMIYGPRDRETFAFFQSIKQRVLPFVGTGRSRMSVIYGADAAAACIRAAEADVPSGSTYFIDDGEIYVWLSMLEEIERAMGRRALVRTGLPMAVARIGAVFSELGGKLSGKAVMFTRDKLNELAAPHWVCNSAAAQRELGWEPKVKWPEGVRLALDWYREKGWL